MTKNGTSDAGACPYKQAPLAHSDFEAMAWEAANAKAKELGWFAASPNARS